MIVLSLCYYHCHRCICSMQTTQTHVPQYVAPKLWVFQWSKLISTTKRHVNNEPGHALWNLLKFMLPIWASTDHQISLIVSHWLAWEWGVWGVVCMVGCVGVGVGGVGLGMWGGVCGGGCGVGWVWVWGGGRGVWVWVDEGRGGGGGLQRPRARRRSTRAYDMKQLISFLNKIHSVIS